MTPSIGCQNCGTTFTDVMFITDSPATATDAEVLCDHCGELSGVTIAEAHEVLRA